MHMLRKSEILRRELQEVASHSLDSWEKSIEDSWLTTHLDSIQRDQELVASVKDMEA